MDIYLKMSLMGESFILIDEVGLFFQIIWKNTTFFEDHKTFIKEKKWWVKCVSSMVSCWALGDKKQHLVQCKTNNSY